jgi:S-adenosylmethionine:tRNA ribosyltransferase-isomerase
MRLADFDYELPPDRIAQRPTAHRDASRLLVLARDDRIDHTTFRRLPDWMRAGDLLVFNDSKVIRARLLGRKASGGRIELLLVEPLDRERWTCLIRSSRAPRVGSRLLFRGEVEARVLERDAVGWVVGFDPELGIEGLDRIGHVPLPPYITRDPGVDASSHEVEDDERYQTVYARVPGAVAAPTAGLHFSEELLARLSGGGVELGHLTLHVGPGTFLPVRTDLVEAHRMHGERFEIPQGLAERIATTRLAGGRVIAVGTTVTRALETAATADGLVAAGCGRSELFIVPGYEFEVVDAMITNFHLPRSTLLMLVAAFVGRQPILEAYRTAIAEGYRFYSYGDAMLLERR